MACDFPILIKNPARKLDLRAMEMIPVPCGSCPTCLRTRVNSWCFRLLQHEKIATSSHFVTLTYGTNEKPGFNESPNGLNTLVKADFQNFIKRLRFSYSYRAINHETGRLKTYYDRVPQIKYFACGEYGAKRQRPHFHAIIFNADIDKIEKAWTHGHVHIGSVTGASITYTLKYMHKGKLVPAFAMDDRVPECQMVSHGLGLNYLTPAIINYHRADLTRMYVSFGGGHKTTMPRYFREKIFTKAQRAYQAEWAQKMQIDLIEKRMREFAKTNPNDNFFRCQAEQKHQYLDNFRRREQDRNLIF